MIHAVILAGGRGSRLGDVRKADLLFRGRRLLDHVAERFSGISGQLLVSCGSYPDLELPDGAVSVADADTKSLGPLAGIAAAARFLGGHCKAGDLLISVAVDSPFLPDDYVLRLAAITGTAGCAAYGELLYPTNASWRLAPLLAALAELPPDTGPKAVLREMDAKTIDWAVHARQDPFANLNSLADLLALQRRSLIVPQSQSR